MRADAVRNLDSVLRTGARLLAEDPGASVSAIAAEAGVDRRTVYRRFASREALREAVFDAKLDAIAEVIEDARLDAAPIAVALHRFVEGIITVVRRYPIDQDQMHCDDECYTRVLNQRGQLAAFMRRAMDEGVIRTDLPDGLPEALLHQIITVLAKFDDHDPDRAADIAVDFLLGGIGQRRSAASAEPWNLAGVSQLRRAA
jgi:AcrR family transcriptional regulator